MHSCPSCAAPLDDDGICSSCGALTRGLFRGLDLGTPQLARAVANGLDFYLLLGVGQQDNTRTIARRYRQLRVLFPDDSSQLAPEPARRFALLELAGRALTDPRLRTTYDDMRATGGAATNTVLRCAGCAAPLPEHAARCAFCGTPAPARPQAPASPPEPSGPPAAEPVDYYAILGLNAEHLLPGGAPAPRYSFNEIFEIVPDQSGIGPMVPAGPPTPADIDSASLSRQNAILLTPGYTSEERDARMEELEIARRILRTDSLRSRYDMLLLNFRQGLYGSGRLDSLRHLQDLVRADIAEERGETVSAAQAAALLKQGLGYLDARLPREALEPLRRAVASLPHEAVAHEAYVRALLTADDPLSLGAHALRMALRSLEALETVTPTNSNYAPLALLCRGLLARDQGDAAAAQTDLRQAAALAPELAPAWRGLAALALARGDLPDAAECCRRALAIDSRDERALLMLCAASLRGNQRSQARETATQIARLRGEGATADSVLRELGV